MPLYGPTDYLDEPPDMGGITIDQLEAAPANPADLNARLGALQGPTLVPVPEPYMPKEYQAGTLDQILENFGRSFGNLQLNRPRGFGGGFAAGLAGGLASQGGRVAQARAKFDAAEQARQRLIDKEREDATKENLRREGEFGQSKTGALISNALATEAFNRNEPIRKAAADRQAKQDLISQQNAERQQRNLERQNGLAATNTTEAISQHFNADPDIVSYREVSNNLKRANAALKQHSGLGDYAIVRALVMSSENPRTPSVVREAEERGVQLSFGELARLSNLPAQFISGDRLKPEGRTAAVKQIRDSAATLKPQYDRAYGQYRERVKVLGKVSGINISPNDVLREYTLEPVGTTDQAATHTYDPNTDSYNPVGGP